MIPIPMGSFPWNKYLPERQNFVRKENYNAYF